MDPEVNPSAESPVEKVEEAVKREWRRHPAVAWIVCIILLFYSVMGLGTIALAVRLAQGPLDLAFALPVLEKIMSHSERLQFHIDHAVLTWQGHKKPLTIEMSDLSISGPMGEYLTIGRADLGVAPWHLLLAQIHFSYAEIQNLSLRIIRLPDGSITLTGAEGKTKAHSDVLLLDNIVDDLPGIDELKLSGMRVIFEDQKEALIRRFDDVNMQITQTTDFSGRSLSGFMTASLTGTANADNSVVAVDFIYDAGDKTMTAVTRLDKTDTRALIGGILYAANLPMIDMLVDGRAEIRLNNNFSLQSLNLQLQGDDGMLYWPRNYGAGLENQKLTKFELRVGFDPRTQTLELDNAEITLKGITLGVSGKISADAGWNKLSGDLTVTIPVLAVDALPAVWPKVWDTGGREWLVDRMDHGRFAHIKVDVPLTATRVVLPPSDADFELAAQEAEQDIEGDKSWDIATGNIKGTFDYTGVTVDYRNPLLPARNTTGTGVFEGMGLTLDIDKATIGNLNVTDGKLFFDDLITPGEGNADLHFDMTGSVAAVFEYLEKEPISYRKKVSIDASNARGNADVDLQINFPTLHDMAVEDVHVKAKAKLTNLIVPGGVKGMTLAGPAYDLEATENDFHISGTGTLDDAAATIDWQEKFSSHPGDAFSSKLDAKIQTTSSVRQKFIAMLDPRIDGVIPADISLVTSPAGKGNLKVTATLDNAAIDFTDPFNAVKERGKAATLKLGATLQNGNIQSIDTLNVTGPGMNIASGKIDFGRDAKGEPILAKAVLKGFRLGMNDADIDATWPTENDLKAIVTGNAFDARDIMGGSTPPNPDAPKKQKTSTGYDVTIKLGKLYLSDLPLENVEGTFVGNTGGTMQMASLDGAANGTPVTLRYTASGGAGDRLMLSADDAGLGLAALGITQRVRGGTLRIEGKPMEKGNPGDMQGKLVLKNFSIAKAPVLAKLINLLSLPGILNILNQDTGLKFERAEAEMKFINRAGGPLIAFKDGRTSGSSLGLTFEGDIDTASDTIAMQGTAVPMSGVNSMLSNIPLVGDILTGGKKGSGIFAATYSVKGSTSDPDVSINPLSVLTPGILRRILFEGG